MGESTKTIRLGTRGSLLAKTQSQLVATELEKRHSGVVVELVVIKTSADQILDKPLTEFGGKGLFTKEIEQALTAGEIDVAVHSFKDVPVTEPLADQTGLVIAAVPIREDPRDVFVSMSAKSFDDLLPGAKVGTASPRRKCQVLSRRPDAKVEVLRGNIDTRLRKLRDGQYDAILLAAAGLRRTGLFDESQMRMLEPDEMMPAPGQGALALQCRATDEQTRILLEALDDSATQTCVSLERVIVAALGGDCHSPIAALARIEQDEIMLKAVIGARDGNPPLIKAFSRCPADHGSQAVQDVLKSLQDQGVAALLAGR